MDSDVLHKVRDRLVKAESEFTLRSLEMSGLERVLQVLQKLRTLRDERTAHSEETDDIDGLLNESMQKLVDILSREENDEDLLDFDFLAWSHEIENDPRLNDPFMLSLGDGSDEEVEAMPSSSRRLESYSVKTATTFLSILKSNGKLTNQQELVQLNQERDDRFFCFTTMAWALAVLGMVITIGFLAADFWLAQRNLAIQIERLDSPSLELPAITVCSHVPSLPSFIEQPTEEYPGVPLFGISAFRRLNGSGLNSGMQELVFPHANPSALNSPIENVIVAEDGAACRSETNGTWGTREMESTQRLNSLTFHSNNQSSSTSEGLCYHCFRVGARIIETLYASTANERSQLFAPAVQVDIFQSALFDICQFDSSRRDNPPKRALANEILSHVDSLVSRDILDFAGAEYEVLFEQVTSRNYKEASDFLCNVYFFSGYFYPSVDSPDIQYTYNAANKTWLETGDGPFYSARSHPDDAPSIFGPGAEDLKKDTYVVRGVRVLVEKAEDARRSNVVSPRKSFAILDNQKVYVLNFKKRLVRGSTEYSTKIQSYVQEKGLASFTAYNIFGLGFNFQTFSSENVLQTSTMSWPEFLTDVFEFIGLFTGVLISSILFPPASNKVIMSSNVFLSLASKGSVYTLLSLLLPTRWSSPRRSARRPKHMRHCRKLIAWL